MARYPIKVLLDQDRKPIIPFTTTNSVVENGTGRVLSTMLGNLDDLHSTDKTSLVEAINEALSAGSQAGLKKLVVDKLPTTNIQTDTIYLVLKTTPKDENVYDEYMYIENKWELIGSTATNLSDYVTKETVGNPVDLQTEDKSNIVNAINEVNAKAGEGGDPTPAIENITGKLADLQTEDKSNLVAAINEVNGKPNGAPIYFVDSHGFIFADKNENAQPMASYIVEAMSNIITDAISKNYKQIIVYMSDINQTSSNTEYSCLFTSISKIDISRTGFEFKGNIVCKSVSQRRPFTMTFPKLGVYGKFVGNVFTASQVYYRASTSKLLPLDNEIQYTPEHKYNPATKDYVDNAIAGVQPTPVPDLTTYTQKNVAETIDGEWRFDKTPKITNAPIYSEDAANKKFVEDTINGITIPAPDWDSITGKPANLLQATDTMLAPKAQNIFAGIARVHTTFSVDIKVKCMATIMRGTHRYVEVLIWKEPIDQPSGLFTKDELNNLSIDIDTKWTGVETVTTIRQDGTVSVREEDISASKITEDLLNHSWFDFDGAPPYSSGDQVLVRTDTGKIITAWATLNNNTYIHILLTGDLSHILSTTEQTQVHSLSLVLEATANNAVTKIDPENKIIYSSRVVYE